MENLSSVFARIRASRLGQNISAAEMAATCGVSAAEYERIEAEAPDVSFGFILKCANMLNTDIASVVTGDDPRLSSFTLSRKGEGMPINRREGFEYSHLAYLLKDRLSEPFVVTAGYSEALENGPIILTNHGGQEFNYVIEGRLKIEIDGHVMILEQGDSLYYDARKPHGMAAAGGADCRFLSVIVKSGADESIEPVSAKPAAKPLAAPLADELIFKRFMTEILDENGYLKDIKYHYPENFNFAYDVIDELAAKCPDKRALLWVSESGGERTLTFSDLSRLSSKAANYFKSLGIEKNDRVMLVLRRHYQFWLALLGLHKLGALAIPATDQLMEKDYVYRFNKAGISAVICTGFGDAAKIVESALPDSPTIKIKSMANGEREGWDSFDAGVELASGVFPRVPTAAAEPMLLYFSSGTTGYPKIVTQNYAYPLGHIITARWWHNERRDGLQFTVADTGWAKVAWGKLYGQWLCESGIFEYDSIRSNPGDLLALFKKYGITTFCAPPTIYRFFIKEDLSRFDLSSLSWASIAGEALNPEVYQQFWKATGLRLMEGYGQTETTVCVANLVGMEPKPGSMGKPVPGYDITLMTANGAEAKTGEAGEIVIRAANGKPPGLFDGYYRDPEMTAEAWRGGYYHTGDMAWKDEDGYFWFVGRTDDLIKSSGYRIGPFEIESVLMEMPIILECAVTGVPDEVRGQVVKATVVLAKNEAPTEETKKKIQDYVKSHTAPYKYPRVIEFAESLPKTISGKIKRMDIRRGDER